MKESKLIALLFMVGMMFTVGVSYEIGRCQNPTQYSIESPAPVLVSTPKPKANLRIERLATAALAISNFDGQSDAKASLYAWLDVYCRTFSELQEAQDNKDYLELPYSCLLPEDMMNKALEYRINGSWVHIHFITDGSTAFASQGLFSEGDPAPTYAVIMRKE